MPDVLMLPVITKVGLGPATLARVAEPMGAPQSRWVELMQDGRYRSIPDLESCLGQLPSEQRVFAETQRSGPQFRIERGHALQNGAAETHAGADQLARPLVKLSVFTRPNPPPVHRTQPGTQEMRRQRYSSGHSIVSAIHERSNQLFHPLLGDDHIVVRGEDDLAPRLGQPRVQRMTFALLRLVQIPHPPLLEVCIARPPPRVVCGGLVYPK